MDLVHLFREGDRGKGSLSSTRTQKPSCRVVRMRVEWSAPSPRLFFYIFAGFVKIFLCVCVCALQAHFFIRETLTH